MNAPNLIRLFASIAILWILACGKDPKSVDSKNPDWISADQPLEYYRQGYPSSVIIALFTTVIRNHYDVIFEEVAESVANRRDGEDVLWLKYGIDYENRHSDLWIELADREINYFPVLLISVEKENWVYSANLSESKKPREDLQKDLFSKLNL